eukprot:756025-Hanusia_phi.AAC.4
MAREEMMDAVRLSRTSTVSLKPCQASAQIASVPTSTDDEEDPGVGGDETSSAEEQVVPVSMSGMSSCSHSDAGRRGSARPPSRDKLHFQEPKRWVCEENVRLAHCLPAERTLLNGVLVSGGVWESQVYKFEGAKADVKLKQETWRLVL